MEIYQIRYFLAVAEIGSFTKAAERCFVTQPTLSAGIRKLEDDLGTRLFSRARRRVGLTDAGERLLARARTIMAEVRAARAETRSGPSHASLTLGVMASLPAWTVAGLVAALQRMDGGIALSIREGRREDLDAWLGQARIEAALTVLPPRGEGASGESHLPFYRSRMVLAASPDHPLARLTQIPIAELHDTPFILRTHCEHLTESRRIFDAHGVRPRIVLRTDRDDRALSLAATGFGVTLTPNHLRTRGLAFQRVAEVDISGHYGLRLRGTGNPALESLRVAAESLDWQRPRSADSPQHLEWAH